MFAPAQQEEAWASVERYIENITAAKRAQEAKQDVGKGKHAI
jgi:hypothetical protein